MAAIAGFEVAGEFVLPGVDNLLEEEIHREEFAPTHGAGFDPDARLEAEDVVGDVVAVRTRALGLGDEHGRRTEHAAEEACVVLGEGGVEPPGGSSPRCSTISGESTGGAKAPRWWR